MATEYLTTGGICKLCKVSPKTAKKWIDSGMLKGHRIPGTAKRRVAVEDLRAFLASSGLDPIDDELNGLPRRARVVVVSRDPAFIDAVRDRLSWADVVWSQAVDGAALSVRCMQPAVVVVDRAIGDGESLDVLTGLRPPRGAKRE